MSTPSNIHAKKKPKIKAIAKKYGFSLYSKKEIEQIIDNFNARVELLPSNQEIKIELSVIQTYYKQRLPIELCKYYLNLPRKSKFNDSEILFIACVKHQKRLLQNCDKKHHIKHIIDGIEYPCQIIFNDYKCDCGVKGYIWQIPNELTYQRSYWLQDEYLPLINIRVEPSLTILDEFNILQKYIKNNCKNKIIQKNIQSKWIHSRSLCKRISVYPIYYQKYWEWEHLPNEEEPKTEEYWRNYFATTGCANHRDLIETMHIHYYKTIERKKKRKNVDFRYGVTLK